MNSPLLQHSRRDSLKALSAGFGFLAFSDLATRAAAADAPSSPLAARDGHFPGKAKRVIFACMRGGPSHVDTFDHKPGLARNDGKKTAGNRKFLKSPWDFQRCGESGLPISDLFPHLQEHADDLCLLNGMYSPVAAHPQAFVQLHTGSFQFVRPSMGSWVLYGLGSENENLPGFITINPPSRVGGAQNYGSAFLPGFYQGTPIGGLQEGIAKGATIPHLNNARMSGTMQERQIELIQNFNKDLLHRRQEDDQVEAVIQSYELAFRMQGEVPEVMDFGAESAKTKERYGIGKAPSDEFGRQCLMARRFAEAGVRFIEVTHSSWDQHKNLRNTLGRNCGAVDKPLAALLQDLKDRDMLDETLVIWGGEFGRTPHVKNNDGRDHNSRGFSFWMAGGGVRGGMRYGQTDENGVAAVDNGERMDFHDLHATILHLLGLDHERLTYNYSGRDFRLTDVHGRVAEGIVA